MLKKSASPLTRRDLLGVASLGALSLSYPRASAFAATAEAPVYGDFWSTNREIHLYRKETGESGRFEYWRDGRLQMPAWAALQVLLRDVRVDTVMDIDVGVINLIWGVQQWVYRDSGVLRLFRATDGARTEHTNATTPGADPHSSHKHGKAIDGRFERFGLTPYAKAARFFGAGGVGLYAAHVHVDTARIRKWGF